MEETWKVAVEKYCGMVSDKAVETVVVEVEGKRGGVEIMP